jgi:S1-C subfamily serine protease
VCAAADHAEYKLVLADGEQVPAQFIRYAKDTDLCLLKTETKIKPVLLAAADADRATHITVIGAPHAQFPFFTEGYISGYHYVAMELAEDDPDLNVRFRAQFTSCPIYPGNSGSPAYNDGGYVVGIMFAGRRDAEHMTLMVPVELIHQFLEEKGSTWTAKRTK